MMNPEQNNHTAQKSDETTTHPVDQKVLDELREVMDDDFIEIIDLYLNNVPSQILNIKAAAEKKDAGEISCGAHNLKSTSGNIGAMTVFTLCKTLEGDACKGKIEGCQETIKDIEAEFERVKVFLETEKQK